MCFYPRHATKTSSGQIKFTYEGELRLPCGTCTECIKKRAIDWALRAKHEISLHKENCFLTLTYDDAHLPSKFIQKLDFQKFLKKVRKKYKLRYMVSYEYGSKKQRPHVHAIIFGYNPPNQLKFIKTSKGDQLFKSEEVSKKWKHGSHSIGTANEKTAYYIASYALKGKKHYVTDDHGEIHAVSDQMNSSNRPAVGLDYLVKYAQQLVQCGKPIPRYYKKKLGDPKSKAFNPDLLQDYENQQQQLIKIETARNSWQNLLLINKN